MAKLTKQHASDRSKKGWKTRKEKGWKAKSKKEKAAYAVGGVASYNAIAHHRNMTKYQHEWVRPNGEIVHLKGFRPKQMADVIHTASGAEQILRPDVKIAKAPLTIRRRRTFAAGWSSFKPTADTFVEETSKVYGKGPDLEWGYKVAAKVRGHSNKKTSMVISSTMAPDKLRGVLGHELGHSIDEAAGNASSTKKYRRATGFKHNAGFSTGKSLYDQLTSEQNAHVPKYRGPTVGYSNQSPVEHFAETVGQAINGKRRVDLHYISPSEEKYMKGKFFKKKGPLDQFSVAHVEKKPGLGQHYDKFLAAGLVVGAASYGGYKLHQHKMETDPKYARKYNMRKTKLTGNLPHIRH